MILTAKRNKIKILSRHHPIQSWSYEILGQRSLHSSSQEEKMNKLKINKLFLLCQRFPFMWQIANLILRENQVKTENSAKMRLCQVKTTSVIRRQQHPSSVLISMRELHSQKSGHSLMKFFHF